MWMTSQRPLSVCDVLKLHVCWPGWLQSSTNECEFWSLPSEPQPCLSIQQGSMLTVRGPAQHYTLMSSFNNYHKMLMVVFYTCLPSWGSALVTPKAASEVQGASLFWWTFSAKLRHRVEAWYHVEPLKTEKWIRLDRKENKKKYRETVAHMSNENHCCMFVYPSGWLQLWVPALLHLGKWHMKMNK